MQPVLSSPSNRQGRAAGFKICFCYVPQVLCHSIPNATPVEGYHQPLSLLKTHSALVFAKMARSCINPRSPNPTQPRQATQIWDVQKFLWIEIENACHCHQVMGGLWRGGRRRPSGGGGGAGRPVVWGGHGPQPCRPQLPQLAHCRPTMYGAGPSGSAADDIWSSPWSPRS